MSKAIVIASYKGGVGKTTLSAALAYIAAENENRVTAVDMDLEFGGLDIALGAENAAGGSILDLFRAKSTPDSVSVPCEEANLFLIGSPMTLFEDISDITPKMVSDALRLLKEQNDLVIFDMPAGGGAFFEMLASCPQTDEVIVVSTDSPTSLRTAEKCGMRLSQITRKTVRLVVNAYHVDAPGYNSAGLLQILDTVSLPALGVIPFDTEVSAGLVAGQPVTAYEGAPASMAVENIFLRLAGEQIPLLDGVLNKRKRKKLY